jgi:hypothetical protein
MSFKRGAFFSFESFQVDFKHVFDKMCNKLWLRQEKYGKGYISNKDVSYYFERLKKETKEYEECPSLDEALDIGNFAMMMIYHLMKGGE